jgi:hypothetical protein
MSTNEPTPNKDGAHDRPQYSHTRANGEIIIYGDEDKLGQWVACDETHAIQVGK